MFTVTNLGVAIALCVVTMLGWGSWANTQKLAGKDKWSFPLYYWDYGIGVFVLGMIAAHTLGMSGSTGMGTRENLHQAGVSQVLRAMASGALFNVANIL